jgi:4-aminobutyrate aminotransferase/(S)-3-amino-2-methylpropionate transaminase
MNPPIQHPGETLSNRIRSDAGESEPRSLRTFTPTQAVLARSAGMYHWTPDGKRLFDFSSGVLVANLGHNPIRWMERFGNYMGWPRAGADTAVSAAPAGFFSALALTSYNAVTPLESEASARLASALRSRPGGARMEQVMWAASGSEAIQKALWAAMAKDRTRPMILATRYGFHGKKGLSNAVTGSEADSERDPRVKFISFPMAECRDVSGRDDAFVTAPYEAELDALLHQFGRRIGVLITEPYLGGGGSYHPPKAYLQLLQRFCRANDIAFILDEVQANFGRTGDLFAFETYGLEPDLVVLGKGLGNGVPVAAVVGRRDLFDSLDYGEGSDTWSANPLQCAAVLATLDEFEAADILGPARATSAVIEAGLLELKRFPGVAHVRGERGGMVWGVEFQTPELANRFVLEAYLGAGGTADGVHLLGPLAKKVVRIAPPLITPISEARQSLAILNSAAERMSRKAASC